MRKTSKDVFFDGRYGKLDIIFFEEAVKLAKSTFYTVSYQYWSKSPLKLSSPEEPTSYGKLGGISSPSLKNLPKDSSAT